MSEGCFMNLILDKLSETDIQFSITPNMCNIGMLSEVRLIGRYYIFTPVTCNGRFWASYASIGRATLIKRRDFIRTKPFCSTKFMLSVI
jgi:hypothetical protein